MSAQADIYQKQGFGTTMPPKAPFGLLIVDFIHGFADPSHALCRWLADRLLTSP